MRSRHLPVIGTALLLAVVVGGAAAGEYWRLDPTAAPTFDAPVLPPPPPPPDPAPSMLPVPPGTGAGSTPWFLLALLVLAVVLLLLGTAYAVRQMLAGRAEPMPEPMDPDILVSGVHAAAGTIDLPVLVDAVEAALARLDAAGTPTDAVVAAWVLLEEAAAAHGWERHPSQTSTEFTAQLLDVSPAPPEHTATLRGLYQRARFTDHPVTPEHVAQARTALAAIARALDGAPA
ncbi:DUF4129 domain-containing protein [Xylanimonas cellulosilytica]|uniref:DUF4129 domain-containing protein n=1 Tax=Xylanimonas cellulosilytica TaxID=186189 RepID=UPI000680927C|nr:DUF4129 domain-containing protein [Xylanimonas cellulosilytica]